MIFKKKKQKQKKHSIIIFFIKKKLFLKKIFISPFYSKMSFQNESISFKNQANLAFSQSNFQDSIDLLTKAIQLDQSNHILFSNRSASYASLSLFQSALEDSI